MTSHSCHHPQLSLPNGRTTHLQFGLINSVKVEAWELLNNDYVNSAGPTLVVDWLVLIVAQKKQSPPMGFAHSWHQNMIKFRVKSPPHVYYLCFNKQNLAKICSLPLCVQFNFVGKLLGPRGNSLKRLQEDTLTKMSILGKGSMRDKEKVG